jgi:small subunit ribosomal protein S9
MVPDESSAGRPKPDARPVKADEPTSGEAPAEVPAVPAPTEQGPTEQPPAGQGPTYVWGTGRRKEAVARVRIRAGSGKIVVNKRPVEEYFRAERDRQAVRSPLEVARLVTHYDVWANVRGGGTTGQADAIRMGLARALAKAVPEISGELRGHKLLTRDARMKERKKYGQKGARKRFQFSKR